jgi:hypothetical protein
VKVSTLLWEYVSSNSLFDIGISTEAISISVFEPEQLLLSLCLAADTTLVVPLSAIGSCLVYQYYIRNIPSSYYYPTYHIAWNPPLLA